MDRIDSRTPLNDLYEIAKKTVCELDKGDVFIVQSLFRGFEWQRILIRNRIKLGSMFLNFAESNGKPLIQVREKTSQNQQKYEKIL
jgi:hypothetical protein